MKVLLSQAAVFIALALSSNFALAENAPMPDFNNIDVQVYLANNLWVKVSPARLPINFLNTYFTGELRKKTTFKYELKGVVAANKPKVTVNVRANSQRANFIACDFVLYYHSPEWGWLVDESVEPVCKYNLPNDLN